MQDSVTFIIQDLFDRASLVEGGHALVDNFFKESNFAVITRKLNESVSIYY